MNLKLAYVELAEIRDAISDRRHKAFCDLTKRSSKGPEELREIQKKLYPSNLRLGEDSWKDKTTQITGIEGPMVICTSILNKLQDLEDELQESLGMKDGT